MNWANAAIVELNRTVRYALRSTGTTVRLCAILATVTACLALLAWLRAGP
jgi:hypothetical protein